MLADLVEFVLRRDAMKGEEEGDAAVEDGEGFAEGVGDLVGGSGDGGGVGDAPMGGHAVERRGVAGPEGADLAGGVVADGDDEVDGGSAGCGELVP